MYRLNSKQHSRAYKQQLLACIYPTWGSLSLRFSQPHTSSIKTRIAGSHNFRNKHIRSPQIQLVTTVYQLCGSIKID